MNLSSSSRRRLCIGVSPLSNRMSFLGPNEASWRHSSEPMEPAAPVTITVLPPKFSTIASMSSLISSRPRRSSIFTSRIEDFMILPSMTSSIDGATSTFTPVSWQKSTSLDASFFTSSSRAKRIASTKNLSRKRAMSA